MRDGDRVVPVVGLTGEFHAALVVAGGGASVGVEGERLISGFARHLGSTLELTWMRRELAEAGERRRATADEMLERGIDLLKVCRRCRRCYDQGGEVCADDQTRLTLPRERLLPRDHLVHHSAEREDVRPGICLLAFQLLGRHVTGTFRGSPLLA